MPSRRFLSLAATALIFAQTGPALRASAALTGRMPAGALRTPSQPANLGPHRHAVGLGAVLKTADGGEIYGFDINMNGSDGVLASSQDTNREGVYTVSVETFDQTSGAITKSFAKFTGARNSYQVAGIFAGDIGLVTHFIEPKNSLAAIRHYDVMNPVAGSAFTGSWTPAIKDESVLLNAENQSTPTSVLYAIELKHQDVPDLIVSDIAANTSKIFHLGAVGLNYGLQLAQDTTKNEAVIAFSPDDGARGGSAPEFALVNLTNGKIKEFTALSNGPYGAGDVNGLAVDSGTGVACTATELNAQVEFYNISKQAGIGIQLPNTGDTSQLNSGSAVANDPVNHLFLVAQPLSSSSSGSSIYVYGEKGNLKETINGFDFGDASTVVPVRIAVNPATRTGWVNGANVNQLQQFFY